VLADPVEEPLDDAEGDMKETTRPMRRTIHRSLFMTTWRRCRRRGCLAGVDLFEQVPACGGDHGGMESRKLNSRRWAVKAGQLPLAIVDMEREVPGKMAERSGRGRSDAWRVPSPRHGECGLVARRPDVDGHMTMRR